MISLSNHGRMAVLAAICLAMFLPGLWNIPPIDRDESRFAQATMQMLESGDYIDIRFQETPRYKKPVGIYWLQAASVSLFSTPEAREIWAYRLPSVLGALIAVLLLHHVGRRLFDPQTAFLAALFTAGSFMLVYEAHQAKTDAVLLATIVGSQAALALIYLDARAGKKSPLGIVLCLWVSLALGFLIKGPIGLMIFILTAGALALADKNRTWLRNLRPLTGLLVFSAIVAPWGLAMMKAGQSAFLGTALREDLIAKLLSGQESHGAPPGYHLALLTLTFWPASLVVFPALMDAWKRRSELPVRFCLAWLIPTWIVFELVPTKLPHYVLPTIPAIALLAANFVYRSVADNGVNGWMRSAYCFWAVVSIALGGALVFASHRHGGGLEPWVFVAAALAVGCAIWGVYFSWQGKTVAALYGVLPMGGALLILGYLVILPGLEDFWLSHRAAQAAAPGRIATDFREPSLVFLRGTRTVQTDAAGMATALARGDVESVIVTDRQLSAFRKTAYDRGLAVREGETLRGFNYSRGKPRTLVVFERE